MSAALLSSLRTENDLSSVEDSTSPLYSSRLASPIPVHNRTGLDWIATLTPRKRSCISFDNVEPCVNKAVAGLEALKHTLLETDREIPLHHHRATVKISSDVQLSTVSVKESSKANNFDTDTVSPKLAVEGVPTGILVQKRSKVPPAKKVEEFDIINGVLNLVARLELDRQDTLLALSDEKVRAEQLEEKLDKEYENRLILLPKLVQAEHEQCFRDIRDMKWHANFEGRKLQKILDSLKVTSKKNEEFKNELKYLTEINPKLEEKLIFEQGRMRSIAQNQQETSDELYRAKQAVLDLEEQYRRVQLLAGSEKKRTEERRNSLTFTLTSENTNLKHADGDVKVVSLKISTCNGKVTNLHNKAKRIDLQCARHEAEYSRIMHSNDDLNESVAKSYKEIMELHEKEQNMLEIKEAEHQKLEEVYSGQMLEMNNQKQDLKKVRSEKEDMEHEIKTLRATIILRNKQVESNEKNIERAHKELIKLDGQMEISMEEFSKVRDKHFSLSEGYAVEKARTIDVEDALKGTVATLKMQLKEDTQYKLLYESKIQADTTEFNKLKVKCQKRLEQAKAISSQLEDQNRGQSEMVKALEEDHAKNVKILESLHSELTAVEEEQAMIEKDLGGRKVLLVPQEQKLKGEVQEKVAVVEILKDKIKDLETNVEDVVKSCKGLEKLEVSTTSAIDKLKVQLDEQEEKLAIENEKEQSWRDEYKEISDFSSDAETKHARYLEERHELLGQYKLDLEKNLSTNSKLAASYHQLQTEFIDVKAHALGVIEKKLELETSLRDHRQLEAFQSCMYSAMKEYYQNRGASSRRDLGHFHSQSQKNTTQLLSLKDQFKTVLTLLHDFLEVEIRRTRSTPVQNNAISHH